MREELMQAIKNAAYDAKVSEMEAQQGNRPSTEWDAATDCLGYAGAMLSGSKRTPHGCEDHTIYWNACVFNQAGVQIWHGDLDVTARDADLKRLASLIGTVYVTPEQPWRFDGFHVTRKDKYEAERLIEFKGPRR